MRRIWLILLCWILVQGGLAQVSILRPNYSEKTLIAPLYFGPNAFPVPDMLDGRVEDQLRVEVAGDGYWGYEGDKTATAFARMYIPLFTDRVNLTIWMPVMEWYRMSEARMATCRVNDSLAHQGSGAGDAYFSTDIQILRNRKWAPDIALRAACKTASGGQYEYARYYDCPGYFIDLSIGKSWYWNEEKNIELRAAGSAGFLCWQTDNGRQNDAVMYGLQVLLASPYVSLRTTWSGYIGWENAGDRPMIIKGRVSGHAKQFEPYIEYQYGIKDYPFHMLRIGLAYHIDILKQ